MFTPDRTGCFSPRLIPVLDLCGGIVVHAVAGERANYRPLQSRLVVGSHPPDVAVALRESTGSNTLYVADLDGIQRASPDWRTIRELAVAGFEQVVDAGVRDAERALRLFDAGVRRVLVPLETSTGPKEAEALIRACGEDRLMFSLDLRAGVPQAPAGSAWMGRTALDVARTVTELGYPALLVLDLAGVGRSGGVPTLPLIAELRRVLPVCELWTGGGVRGWEDIEAAANAGVDGVIVATAVHNGALNGRRRSES